MTKNYSTRPIDFALAEERRAADERAQMRRDGISLPDQHSRSGRTMIWCTTPTRTTFKFTRNDGTFKYRDVPITLEVQS